MDKCILLNQATCCGNVNIVQSKEKIIRDIAVLILQSCVEVKHCILSFHQPTRSHVKPIYLAGGKSFSSPCAVVREVHGGSEMFVFVLLADFSACGRSQFLGAPRECISTDGGFNWSVGFQNQGYMLLQPTILICCLLVCLFAYVVFSSRIITGCADKSGVVIMLSCSYRFKLLIRYL